MAYGQGSFNGTSFPYEAEISHRDTRPREEKTTLSGKKVIFEGPCSLPRWPVRTTLSIAAYNTLLGLYQAGTSGNLVTEYGYTDTAVIEQMDFVEGAGPNRLQGTMVFLIL